MEARLIAIEERPRQTEDVLVSERLARQTAEADQQAVGPQPQPAGAGVGGGSERRPGLPCLVDTKAIGKPPTFSGDVDVDYEEQSGDKVSENIKLAVPQKYLCDGELARHLNLQSSRLTTYDLARKEAIYYLRAKQTWTAPGGSDPMDLSPLGKVKGGKKGEGKGKSDKSVEPKECFYCGKSGHNNNECRNFSPALRKKSVQPDKAGRYAGVEVDPETGW